MAFCFVLLASRFAHFTSPASCAPLAGASRTLKTSYRSAFALLSSGALPLPPFRSPLLSVCFPASALPAPHSLSLDQALDRLVLTSFRITAFTPSTYQPCRLQGVLPAFAVGYFFSRGASRLDAFSVYPVRTSLPCYAVGTTTVAPEVRPFRSSRTRNSSSHVSYAHDG